MTFIIDPELKELATHGFGKQITQYWTLPNELNIKWMKIVEKLELKEKNMGDQTKL